MADVNKIAKIALGAGLLWYGVLRGAKALVIGVRDWKFGGINLEANTVQLYLNFLIKNPLFVGITLRSIQGDIYIQGQKAGYINTTVDYYLSGFHTHVVPVVVNLDMGGVLKSVLANIMSEDVRSLTISFDGKIYAGKYSVGIPVNINLDYNDLIK